MPENRPPQGRSLGALVEISCVVYNLLYFCNYRLRVIGGIRPILQVKLLNLKFFLQWLQQRKMRRRKPSKRNTIGGTGHVVESRLATEGD